MAQTIRVLVVDDHPLVRASVSDLLTATDGIAVIGAAVDGRAAVELTADLHPDVVLMDVTMPTMNGLETARVLAARGCRARVLMFSADVGGGVVEAAREAGAAGFLPKGSRAPDLVHAIRTVHAGGTTWPSGA